MALSQETIDIVKATAPVVGENAEKITSRFYPIMFERYPMVKEFFNQSHQRDGLQQKALAGAVVAYALNIDNLGALGGAVEGITERHASLNVQPEHYPIVGECLLAAIAEVLGDAVTPEIANAWGEAYGFLAEILIGAEKAKYAKTAEKAGGWNGYKSFKVIKKVKESASITSFYFEAEDGTPIISYDSGQYISMKLDLGEEQKSVRNYSLSNWGGKYLRISVKKDGDFSTHLHDKINEGDCVELNAPYGVFKLAPGEGAVVLVSGGVGITPMLSMLNQLSKNESTREVSFLHGTQNKDELAFEDEVKALTEKDNFSYEVSFSDEGKKISIDDLKKASNNVKETDFYVCGPVGMMKALCSDLKSWGVADENIHYEYFGPSGTLS
ncbi:flavohemoglobin [Lentisphaera araneosa HTCC2155]|jgi:nitric oxide dioxygenase|uniref:nitric oxide dioxygenase n=1 Tax=Lentisphaera araneosa HTCC2155 TaxID=313628 RepID=A6DJX1_9BACT|nr:NO-inducible flavohemoprotein [Lentisphaera araneosa]EDM28195.1 flavohemoglobin [Lentisphaera araneosa HTCC2155]